MIVNGTMLLRCLEDSFLPDDESFHNWLMISVAVCYGLAAFIWAISLAVSPNKNQSTLYVILGVMALFTVSAAATNIHGTSLDTPATFFLQSISKCLLLLCLMWASTGHQITRSSRDVSVNQFLAVGACVIYASFDVFAISGQIGYPVAQIVYPVLFVGFSIWILINATVTKGSVKDSRPRQLFFSHLTEGVVIYVSSISVLYVINYVGCYYSWKPMGYAITQATQCMATFLLMGMLMIMLRPSRMELISFGTTEIMDEKKILVEAMHGDVSVEA